MLNRSICSLIIILFLSACDKIETPLVDQGLTNTQDILWDDTSTNIYDNTQKVILVEEFTGHTCRQCPAANTLLENIKATYSGQVISVAIHAGNFAETENNTDGSFGTDFSTPEGESYFTTFGVFANPLAMIGRLPYNNALMIGSANWEPVITNFQTNAPLAKLALTTLYDDSTRTIQVNTQIEWQAAFPENTALQLFLIEDNIVDWQKDDNTDIPNYTHKHVLRKAINGTWGTPVPAVDSTNYSHSLMLQEDWDPIQLEVVGFLYNTTSYEVYQANKTIVSPE